MSRLELGNEIEEGTNVKVINGPFANMFGRIKSIDMANQKVEVTIDLFGQETVVELALTDIAKA